MDISAYLFRESFDRDRRILIEWEKIGDLGDYFYYIKNWKKRYKAGETVNIHRIGMWIQFIYKVLLKLATIALAIVLIMEILKKK